MANLDTEQKRKSAVGVCLPAPRVQFNDGTKAQAWRQNAAFVYAGILAGGYVPPTGGPYYYNLLCSQ